MTWKLNYSVFLSFALLYFFCNNTFLPLGLLYTALFTPLFLYWLYKEDRIVNMAKWSLLLVLPVPLHLILGFDIRTYIISTGLVITAWVFLFTAIEAIKKMNSKLEDVFEFVLFVNIILVLIVFIALQFNLGSYIFWHYTRITHGVSIFPRLMLMSYEPSHYSLLLSPVFLFFILKILTGQSKHTLLLIPVVALPIVLSLSFGVIGGLGIAIVLALLISFRKLPKISKNYLIFGFMFLFAIIFIFMLAWPSNTIFIRVVNIFTGNDTSGNGRMTYAFRIANDMVNYYHAWMGVGPGQVKMLFNDLIVNFYHNQLITEINYRIPNSMAEMLATYGFYGFVLKIGLEVYFFIRMKIYQNLYSLTLFIFIFIYQFTGSFTVNVAELGTWALVFQSRFTRFDFKQLKTTSS